MHDFGEPLPNKLDGFSREHDSNRANLPYPLPCLTTLRGDPSDLYRSSLICEVQELKITELNQMNVQWLRLLLPFNCPSSLTLKFDMTTVAHPVLSVLESILRVVGKLKELSIDLCFQGDPDVAEQILVSPFKTTFSILS